MKSPLKKLIFHLNASGHSATNPVLLRLYMFPNLTKIDFGYTTTNLYINGGWIKMAPETYIENTATHEKFVMTHATGITIAPEMHNFKSNKDWQYYSLYFPPIPQKDATINIIEVLNGTKNDFNYYNITLKMVEGIEII